MPYVNVCVCDECWHQIAGPREPVRVVRRPEETCDECGIITTSGIFIRRWRQQ